MDRSSAILCIAAMVVLACSSARADQLILNDGTVLEGKVLKQGEVYWIKLDDGGSRLVPIGDVKSHVTKAPAASTPSAAPAGGDQFLSVKRKADAVESPLVALALWEKFLDSKPAPAPADATAARAEMGKWKKLNDDRAEKIAGKWVAGEERTRIVERANTLVREAMEIYDTQTLQARRKLEEAVKLYPNSHQANFVLGDLCMDAKTYDQAIKYFEQGLRVSPNNPDALNNLGVAMIFKKDYNRGLDFIFKAVSIEDSQQNTQNLVNALDHLPPERRNTPQVKKALEAANILATKHNIGAATDSFVLLPPKREAEKKNETAETLPPGVRSGGTGFIIRDDGLILTNRHVIENASSVVVLLPGGRRRTADVVKIDSTQDLALIRVQVGDKLPIAMLAAADVPPEGISCYAMGFPLFDSIGVSVKITQGMVSGLSKGEAADVVFDAKVNPGNSGGPLLDAHASVIGVVTMKTLSSEKIDSYGLAISVGRVRRFLSESQVTLPAAGAEGQSLTADQIATKIKPATVCILSIR